MQQDGVLQDIVAQHITVTIRISAVQLARRLVIAGADGYLRIKETVKKMQYELWRFRDKSGKMGQIYLLNPKSPLERVKRKDIMESGGVCVGRLESELDARQLMEGFTYYKSQTIWALREAFAGLDKKLTDTRPLSSAATNKIKADIMGFKEMLQIFEEIDVERAAAGDYAIPEDKGVGSNGTL